MYSIIFASLLPPPPEPSMSSRWEYNEVASGLNKRSHPLLPHSIVGRPWSIFCFDYSVLNFLCFLSTSIYPTISLPVLYTYINVHMSTIYWSIYVYISIHIFPTSLLPPSLPLLSVCPISQSSAVKVLLYKGSHQLWQFGITHLFPKKKWKRTEVGI